MSFINAYSDYHQIPMFGLYQENTLFITTLGIYCYKVMTFGLRNTGKTYQKLITKMFKKLIDSTMEVYINDMLVRSKYSVDYLRDLIKTFNILIEYKINPNVSNCEFRVSSGKFLSYLVTQKALRRTQMRSKLYKTLKN